MKQALPEKTPKNLVFLKGGGRAEEDSGNIFFSELQLKSADEKTETN